MLFFKMSYNKVEPNKSFSIPFPSKRRSFRRSSITSGNGSIADSVYASTVLSVDDDGQKTKKYLNDQQWVLQVK